MTRIIDNDVLGQDEEQVVAQVRERYGRIADGSSSSCCAPESACSDSGRDTLAQGIGYDEAAVAAVPDGANMGLGCGAPIRHLAPIPGETVLDLGSGAGFDALLAAPLVGATGRVIGVDMTPEMLDKARTNAATAGYSHVEFREGRLEALPLEDASVDAVTSNCVINLVPDKSRAFAEIARVLRPGGRLVISDIVLQGELPERLRGDLLAYVGCIAGAMPREAYFDLVRSAGLTRIEPLAEIDYLAKLGEAIPAELAEIATGLELDRGDLLGRVYSVTYRAIKPV